VTPVDWKPLSRHIEADPELAGRQSLVTPIDWKLPLARIRERVRARSSPILGDAY